MSTAYPVLERLLRRAEKARLRGEETPVSLSMTGIRDAAEYLRMRTLPEFESFHASLRLAERDGAIAVQRDHHRGDGEKVLRISVASLDVLARHLGVAPLAERAARAAARLKVWTARFPVIGDALVAWRNGRKARGHEPEAAEDLADAAHAVDALLADAREERILRKESARLFGDSKRLEALTPWLDVLVSGELDPSGLEKEQIWSAIGLRREPQPLLLAGSGTVELEDATCLSLPRPYLGVPVEALRGLVTSAQRVLSIENLASFHDAARARGDAPILLLYTGGMPSPTWRAAYQRILRGIPAGVPIHHWGDIDEGGFRIAAKLADSAREVGFTLRPWRMSPADVPAAIRLRAGTPSPPTLTAMCRWAERAGWSELAADLQRMPLKLEQESLDPTLPT